MLRSFFLHYGGFFFHGFCGSLILGKNQPAIAVNHRGDNPIGEMNDPEVIGNPIMNHPMIAKFAIHYIVFPEHNKREDIHYSDDPVAAETFLMHLLTSGARINSISHDGAPMETHQFDRMLRVATDRLAAHMLSRSLDLDYVDVKHRFGFSS